MEQTATLQVKNEQNPLEKLSLDVVKGTKKQLKQEDKACSFYSYQRVRMGEEEFNALIGNNPKCRWLETKRIHDDFAFGTYFKVPVKNEEWAQVYVITFPYTESGLIQTSFYVYNKDIILRAAKLEDVQTIINNLKYVWLSIFREVITDRLENLQANKAEAQKEIN